MNGFGEIGRFLGQNDNFSGGIFFGHFFKTKNWVSMRKFRKISWLELEKLVKMAVFGPKWPFLDRFWPKMVKTRFFRQKAKLSLFNVYRARASWKKSEKSHARISRKLMTDGRTDERESIGLRVSSRPKIDLFDTCCWFAAYFSQEISNIFQDEGLL